MQKSGEGRGYPRSLRCRRLSTLALKRNEILSNSYLSSLSSSLLLPIPSIHYCCSIKLHVYRSTMYPLSCISATAIVRRLSPLLSLSAIPVLSHMSASSVVILPHLCCGNQSIVFHLPASFNEVICLCVFCVSISHSSLSIYLSPPEQRVGGETFLLPLLILLFL